MKHWLSHWLGMQGHTSVAEKTVALLGAIAGIAAVYYLSYRITGYEGAMAMLPSMGAAAVLLFAVPHGPLSQPWALLLGNTLSAAVGVTCARWVGDIHLAAALAVGLAIFVMHMARAIHPPGGATALAAVIGGQGIHDLGYGYVLVPTLLNCTVLLVMAIVFNYAFRWRRYPLGLMRFSYAPPARNAGPSVQLRHIEEAVEQMDILLDVSAEEIMQVLDKAQHLLRTEQISHLHIERGAFYTNARPGLAWSVRQIVDESPHVDPQKYQLIYRTVEGAQKGVTGTCTLDEFAQWAREKMHPAKAVMKK